ncbi:MAG: HflK protein, partial [Zetaproteobacteria bacterium CG_4_8_14_3_um_filter_59_5]
MPWSDPNQSNNPWGNRPNQQQPDLDEVVKRLQEKFSKIFGGGNSGSGGSGIGKGAIIGGLVAMLLLWFASGLYVVAADEEAVVLRFGQHIATKGPGL